MGHLRALAEAYDVTVVANTGNHDFLRQRGLDIRVVPVAIARDIHPVADLRALFSLIRLFRKEHFDLIHSVTPKAGLLAMSVAKGRTYNLSDHCSMESMVEVIVGELECRLPAFRVPELPVRWTARILEAIPGFPLSRSRVDALTNHAVYPIDRIRTEMGYAHVVSMEEGLQQLVTAWKSKL